MIEKLKKVIVLSLFLLYTSLDCYAQRNSCTEYSIIIFDPIIMDSVISIKKPIYLSHENDSLIVLVLQCDDCNLEMTFKVKTARPWFTSETKVKFTFSDGMYEFIQPNFELNFKGEGKIKLGGDFTNSLLLDYMRTTTLREILFIDTDLKAGFTIPPDKGLYLQKSIQCILERK